MNVFIDIETIPQQPEEEAKAAIAETIETPANMKKPETIEAWHKGEGQYAGVKDGLIESKYRQTSFDGAKGQICSIAWSVNGAMRASLPDQSEKEMLKMFFDSMADDLSGRPPFFIGHYIGGFDLKFLFHRAVILGIRPCFDLPFSGRHGQHFYDTMQAWAGFRDSISLNNLCKALGIEGKGDDIDGSKVWDYYKAGRHEEIIEYNISDVEKVIAVYERLNFQQTNIAEAA